MLLPGRHAHLRAATATATQAALLLRPLLVLRQIMVTKDRENAAAMAAAAADPTDADRAVRGC